MTMEIQAKLNAIGMAAVLAAVSSHLREYPDDQERIERALSDFCDIHGFDMGPAHGGGFWIEPSKVAATA